MKLLTFVLAAVVLSILSTRGDSLVLQPDADTSLFSHSPTNNLGASTNLISGDSGNNEPARALLHFDIVGHLPSNALVQSAALTVTVVIVPPGGLASTFDLRRVEVAWLEGTGIGLAGNLANPGEVTWDYIAYPSIAWSTPGGSISNEYSPIVSASTSVTTSTGSFTFDSNSNLVADVQQWLRNPGTNFGWVLLSESESTLFSLRRFASREQTNMAPALLVQYIVPSPPEIQSIVLNGDQIELGFSVLAGVSYTVEYTDALNSGSWLVLTNPGPQTVSTNLIVADPFNPDSQRCYRISSTY